jgi:putative glutamine amidotransferase
MPRLDKGDEIEKKEYETITETYAGKSLYKLNNISFNMAFKTDIECIEKAGGIPIVIPYMEDRKSLDQLLDILDGVVFTGGFDVNPELYGENDEYIEGLVGTLEGLKDEDGGLFSKIIKERDDQEIYLLDKILKNNQMPVLGICRGVQMINVSLGGSLYQDIFKQRNETTINHSDSEKWDDYVHKVNIIDGTFLSDILGKEEIDVNSLHHQAIKNLGDDLIVSAMSPDGIIEAVEFKDKSRFVLGVQWHPEMIFKKDKVQMNLLESFVNEAHRYKSQNK